MKRLIFALAVLACSPLPSAAGVLQLSIEDGKVSLDAQDVTVRQIMAEWARIGKTRIVNGERVSGGPITIRFTALPEKQALEIILRHVPGFMAAPRESAMAHASRYDTIMIMATTTPVAARAPAPPPVAGSRGPSGPVTQFQQPPPNPGLVPDAEDPDDDADPAIAAASAAGLVPAPAPLPGMPAGSAPPAMPGASQPGPAVSKPAPTNPWNAPVGTPQPSLAPPPPPPTTPQAQPSMMRPRPPQPDQ